MQSLKPPTHSQPLQTPTLHSPCLIPPSKLPNLSPFLTLIFHGGLHLPHAQADPISQLSWPGTILPP